MTDGDFDIKESGVVLAIADPVMLRSSVLDAIQQFSQEKTTGIIISFSEPQIILKKALENINIDTSAFLFIDCVTVSATGKPGQENNCYYVNKCSDLTGIGIAVTKALSSVEEKENMFIVLDSVSTMLIYNDSNIIIRFLHMLINKIRLNNANGVLFSAKNAIDPIVSSPISVFTDSVIYIE